MGYRMSRNYDLICPGCGRGIGPANNDSDENSAPPAGAVVACAEGLTVDLYGGGTWRAPTNGERALIMTDERMVKMMNFQQEIALWQDADRGRIINCLMPFLLALSASATTVDVAAGQAADALIAADFHTHPDEDMMEAYASDE